MLGCWNGAVYLGRKRMCIFVLSVKPSVALKLLKQDGCPNSSAQKRDFSLFLFSLN